MKRRAAYALLAIATVYSLFVLVLIFVGCFTAATVFPHDPHGAKAELFAIFSLIMLAVTWGFGCCLYADSEGEA